MSVLFPLEFRPFRENPISFPWFLDSRPFLGFWILFPFIKGPLLGVPLLSHSPKRNRPFFLFRDVWVSMFVSGRRPSCRLLFEGWCPSLDSERQEGKDIIPCYTFGVNWMYRTPRSLRGLRARLSQKIFAARLLDSAPK